MRRGIKCADNAQQRIIKSYFCGARGIRVMVGQSIIIIIVINILTIVVFVISWAQ